MEFADDAMHGDSHFDSHASLVMDYGSERKDARMCPRKSIMLMFAVYLARKPRPACPPVAVWVIAIVCILCIGCRAPGLCCDRSVLRRGVQEHACKSMPTQACPGHEVIPASVVLSDGLSEDEAVCIALANNSLFQATVAQLSMAGGDAVQASLLANPQTLIYFPVGSKQGQYTLYAPIESYLLRPYRVKVANREFQRIGEQLVQNGLNLVRDVRNAYTDYSLALAQSELTQDAVDLRSEIGSITEKRLADGDISELETVAARVDQLNAGAARANQQMNVQIMRARLLTLMGVPFLDITALPTEFQPATPVAEDESTLVARALACRPDYHSATWSVAAANERAELARWMFVRMDGVIDVRTNSPGTLTGPGMRLDLPIFNRNEGGRMRADAECIAALHNRDAIRDQIVQDVRTAHLQLNQSQNNLSILQSDVLPALQEAIAIANKGYSGGGTDYLLVLQTTSQFLDARTRILDQTAATRRAYAELERSVARCLAFPADAIIPALEFRQENVSTSK